MKEKRYNDLYMDLAERISKMSHAKRLQVGSVLVKNDNILSYGWNGMPSGWTNDCEDRVWDPGSGPYLTQEEMDTAYPYKAWHNGVERDVRYGLKSKPEVLHSEANCLMKNARSTNSCDGATLFVTHAPCLDCAKMIYQSGINSVFYRNTYRDEKGIDFLNKCNIGVNIS